MDLASAALWAWLSIVIAVMLVYAVRHLVLTLARVGRRQRPYYHELLDSDEPPLSVLIPMHNEGAVADRILSHIVCSDFPKERLQVVPVDDHSSDSTPESLSRFAAQHEYIQPLTRREGLRGKPAALNDAIELTDNERTLIFDADYLPSGELMRGLSAAFTDPEVGAVMGRVVPHNTDAGLLARLLDLERSAGYQIDQQARYSLDLLPQYGGTAAGFRRSIVHGWGGFDPRVLAEDTDLTFQLYLRGWQVAYANWAECYEEVPSTWDGRFRQLRRWARGHTQVLARRWLAVIVSPYLNGWQKLDGLLVLGIYLVPPLLLTGLVANTLLFLNGSTLIAGTVVVSMFAVGYSAFGNFAPFYQVGAAGVLDGSGERLLLLPLFFFMYFFNSLAVTLGVLDGMVDLARRRAPTWDKTRRQGDAP